MRLPLLSFFLFALLTISSVFGQVQDCQRLNNFLKRNEDTKCCGIAKKDCDAENYILKLELKNSDLINVNINDFPNFQRLQELSFEKENLNILPDMFFNLRLPKLQKLIVTNSNITQIPKVMDEKSEITEINLGNNQITEFPYQFCKLGKINHILLAQNKISGSLDLKDCDKPSPFSFKQLDVSSNNIDSIKNIPKTIDELNLSYNKGIKEFPPEILDLILLKKLGLNGTSITELPPNLFKLEKLKNFHIADNPDLKTNIINFGNGKPIDQCSFDPVNIGCYQSNTCSNIDSTKLKECDNSQINEIKNKQTESKISSTEESNKENDDKNNSSSSVLIIIGLIIIILLITLIGAIFYRKNSDNNNDTAKINNAMPDDSTKDDNNPPPNSNNKAINNQSDIFPMNNMSFTNTGLQLNSQIPIISQNNFYPTSGIALSNNPQLSMAPSNNFYPTTGITIPNSPQLSMLSQNNFIPATTNILSSGNNSQLNINNMSLLASTSVPIMNSTTSMMPISSPIQSSPILPMTSTIQNTNMPIVAPVRVEYDIPHSEDITKNDLPPPYTNDGLKISPIDTKNNFAIEKQFLSQNKDST